MIKKDCIHNFQAILKEQEKDWYCFHHIYYPEPMLIDDKEINCEGCEFYEEELKKTCSYKFFDRIVKDILQGFTQFSNDIVFIHPKEKSEIEFAIEKIDEKEKPYLMFLYILNQDRPHIWGQLIYDSPFWRQQKELYFSEIKGSVGGYSMGEMYGCLTNNIDVSKLTHLQSLLFGWTKRYIGIQSNWQVSEYFLCEKCNEEIPVLKWSAKQECHICNTKYKKEEWTSKTTIHFKRNYYEADRHAEIDHKNWVNWSVLMFMTDTINDIVKDILDSKK